MENTGTEWLKCPHGIEKRSFAKCQKCHAEEEQRNILYRQGIQKSLAEMPAPARIPIKRGCNRSVSGGGCFCDGSCKEIIGYREPAYFGERP